MDRTLQPDCLERQIRKDQFRQNQAVASYSFYCQRIHIVEKRLILSRSSFDLVRRNKLFENWAVAVAQSLPTPEICGSNPAEAYRFFQ